MPPRSDRTLQRRGAGRPFRLVIALLLCAMFIPSLIGWSRAAIECRMLGGGEQPQQSPSTATYARPEEQTYLTLPEWYIVYSADEYAASLAKNPPSQFPYFQAVGQFWQAYYDVCTVTRDRYPFNVDYHVTLAVIGVSFTAENVVKGIYENTIGRLSEWSRTGGPTPEEAYGQRVAAEYGTFIHTVPWYKFPFWEKVGPLWSVSLSGPNMARRVERRFALSLEYAVKSGYGWAIKTATESAYAPEDLEIVARTEGVTPELVAREPQVRIVQNLEGPIALVTLPRYEAFTLILPQLVDQDVRFLDIAGNDEIMLTVLAPRDWKPGSGEGDLLFAMPILTQPDRTRFAVRVPVGALHSVIGNLVHGASGGAVTLEHVYDY